MLYEAYRSNARIALMLAPDAWARQAAPCLVSCSRIGGTPAANARCCSAVLPPQDENKSAVLLSAALVDQTRNLIREVRIVAAESRAPLGKKALQAAKRLVSAAGRIARHIAKGITVTVYIPLGDGPILIINYLPGQPLGKPTAPDDDGDGTE
jgi:hypothetical protein